MLSRSLERVIDDIVPLTANRYLLSRNGILKNSCDLSKIPLKYTNFGEPVADIDFGYGIVSIKIAVLLAIKYKTIRIPHKYWKLLDVLYVDGDSTNFDPLNTVWKFPCGGIRINRGDFRIIPGFSRYQIDSDGAVYSNCTHHFLSPYSDGNGYLMYGVTPDVGKRTIVGMHRLIALAFLDYPANVDVLDVNHLDGVKHNNKLTNLEWANRKRNCDHAYSTGLRSDNVELLVRNVFTGAVHACYSISDCSRKLKISDGTVSLRLGMGVDKVHYPGFQFKKKSDNAPWPTIDDPIRSILENSINIPICITNLSTGESSLLPDRREAASKLGISYAAFNYHFKSRVRDIVLRNFRVFYPDFEKLSRSYFAEMQK